MSNICYNLQSIKESAKIDETITQSQKDLSSFFNIKIRLPNVILVQSRKQYDDILKFKTEDWMVGNANSDIIFILDPSIYTKESTHKNISSFYDVLIHEYTHIAIKAYCGHHHPRWLNEGLCCYLAKQSKKKPSKLDSLQVVTYYSKNDSGIYDIGAYWVQLLVSHFGKQKLLKLLKKITCLTTQKEFNEIFYSIYKTKFTKQALGKLYR